MGGTDLSLIVDLQYFQFVRHELRHIHTGSREEGKLPVSRSDILARGSAIRHRPRLAPCQEILGKRFLEAERSRRLKDVQPERKRRATFSASLKGNSPAKQ